MCHYLSLAKEKAMQQPNKKTSKKPWHKKPWGIALIVLSVVTVTFPIPLVVIMWQKEKFNKVSRIVITAIIATIYISAVASYGETPQTSDNKANESKSSEQQTEPPEKPTYEIKIAGNTYADPTSRRLTFTVKNTGTVEFTPACSVTVENPAGTYRGYDYITWNTPLAPGDTKYFEGLIVITNEGAAYATHADVICSSM